MTDAAEPKRGGRPKKPDSQKKKRKTIQDLVNEWAEEKIRQQKKRSKQPSLIDQMLQEQKRQPVCDEFITEDELDAWEADQVLRKMFWRFPE